MLPPRSRRRARAIGRSSSRCVACPASNVPPSTKEILEGGEKLDALLAQFITVRLTNAASIDYRMLISQGVMGCNPGFFPLSVTAKKRAGVRGNDVITAVDESSTNLHGRAFLVWFRQRHDAGDRVTMTMRNSLDETKEISYELSKNDP